jgi:hypothetical protein
MSNRVSKPLSAASLYYIVWHGDSVQSSETTVMNHAQRDVLESDGRVLPSCAVEPPPCMKKSESVWLMIVYSQSTRESRRQLPIQESAV